MWIPLYVICCFSLAAFNILSLCLIFVSLINVCLSVFFLVYPVWDSLCFLDFIDYFLPHVGEVFNYNLFKYFLRPFPFFFFFWDAYNSNVGTFNVVPEVSKLFSFFFLYSALQELFPLFFSPVTYPFFCLSYSATDSF